MPPSVLAVRRRFFIKFRGQHAWGHCSLNRLFAAAAKILNKVSANVFLPAFEHDPETSVWFNGFLDWLLLGACFVWFAHLGVVCSLCLSATADPLMGCIEENVCFNLKHTQKTATQFKNIMRKTIILQDPGICISSRGLSDVEHCFEAILNEFPPPTHTFLSCRICTTSPMTWCVSCLLPSQTLKSSTLNLTSTKKDWSASGSSMKSLLILMR